MVVYTLRRRRVTDALVGWLAGITLSAGLLVPLAASAEISAATAAPLNTVLQSGQAEAVKLTWTLGRPGEALELLRIDGGRATLQRCEPAGEAPAQAGCAAVGAPLTLTPGQRGQLVSVLRAAELPSLRTADPDARAAADRALELAVAASPRTTTIGRWQLARSDWPTPPDGYGLASYLDELAQKLRRGAQTRPPVAIPSTVAELAELRLQLRLTPRARPGGLVTIEHGLVHVTPAEGSLPRSPPPPAWERPLQPSEAEQLVKSLQAAQLDHLDQVVAKRAAPAIGDSDGRLATLHLMRAEPVVSIDASPPKTTSRLSDQPAPKPNGSAPATAPLREEPRGVERYLTDLMRSAAQPLLSQLVELLLAPPPAPAPRARKPSLLRQ